MKTTNRKSPEEIFTPAEKALLQGLSQKIAEKHRCSGMYVRYIINGKRGTESALAQNIIKDLKALLKLLSPAAISPDA